ncbi:hypothetical protein [Legionella sp.]|uniref:hypothetical protein n=1 Tax=Legionella sp. TaxID=459 RepID=UPI003C846DEB
MNIYQFEKGFEQRKNKATKDAWFKHGVRTDLNTLIVKTTKQNELIEQLVKKIDFLSSERKI